MRYTLVHCADIHLETTFAELRGGARRRAALADAFVRAIDLALELGADALTIGGDLYEAQCAGPQTARFIYEQCGRFGRPVFVAPGNHDPFGPTSLYARADVPANVRVFNESAWSPVPLAEGITLYGFGHAPAEPDPPFVGAHFERVGVRLALVHGSDAERCPPNKRATAPFTLAEIARSGATLALAGHYHGGYVACADGATLAYPGSPEPIKFGESGTHGALVVRIEGDAVRVEAVELARTRLVDRTCDLSGASNEPAVLTSVEAALAGLGTDDFVRLRLGGQVAEGTRVDATLIAERYGSALGALDVLDRTRAYDYARLAHEPTVRGRVVADLLALSNGEDALLAADAERALHYALDAFDGSDLAP